MGERDPVAKYECFWGWYAEHSSEYGWTSVHDDARGLPEALEGLLIVVEMGPPGKYGPDLGLEKVEEVLERTPDRAIVRGTKYRWPKAASEPSSSEAP